MKTLKTRISRKKRRVKGSEKKKHHYEHYNSNNLSYTSVFENDIPNNPCDVYEIPLMSHISLSHESSTDKTYHATNNHTDSNYDINVDDNCVYDDIYTPDQKNEICDIYTSDQKNEICDISYDIVKDNGPKNITTLSEFNVHNIFQRIETTLKCPACSVKFNVLIQIYDEDLSTSINSVKQGFVFCSDVCSRSFKRYKARKLGSFSKYKRSVDDSTSVDAIFVSNVSIPTDSYVAFTLVTK